MILIHRLKFKRRHILWFGSDVVGEALYVAVTYIPKGILNAASHLILAGKTRKREKRGQSTLLSRSCFQVLSSLGEKSGESSLRFLISLQLRRGWGKLSKY